MGCSSCQQNNHVVPTTVTTSTTLCECACGCTDPVCPTPQPCTEITDSKCIIYTDLPIKCGTDTVVTTNASVSTALNQVVAYFCSHLGFVTTADILCGTTVIVPANTNIQDALDLVVQFICNIQLTPGPQGPQGIQGPVGPTGPAGAAGLYSQTRNSNVITFASGQGSVIGTGVGTLTVPANGFQVGNSFKAVMHGDIRTTNNEQLKLFILSNGVILAESPVITLPQITNRHWNLDVDFTIRQVGGPTVASLITGAKFIYNKDANNIFEGVEFKFTESTLFNTTVANTLSIEARWLTNNSLNSIYSDIFTLFKTF
jgi:hypothetical protein